MDQRFPPEPVLRIDCDECVAQGTDACDDCIVTHLCSSHEGALVVRVSEARALRALHDAGLVPALRHRRRTAEPA